MADYIDRDALKDRIAGFVPLFIDESNQAYVDGLTDAYTLICQAPAACVVERKTGKWVKISPAGIRECSLCHHSILTSDIDVYKFCFSCGAKMIGGDDDV